jgi:hypothetical protein
MSIYPAVQKKGKEKKAKNEPQIFNVRFNRHKSILSNCHYTV